MIAISQTVTLLHGLKVISVEKIKKINVAIQFRIQQTGSEKYGNCGVLTDKGTAIARFPVKGSLTRACFE
jgi:hypothetical protein